MGDTILMNEKELRKVYEIWSRIWKLIKPISMSYEQNETFWDECLEELKELSGEVDELPAPEREFMGKVLEYFWTEYTEEKAKEARADAKTE